jgi:hypothetical protein
MLREDAMAPRLRRRRCPTVAQQQLKGCPPGGHRIGRARGGLRQGLPHQSGRYPRAPRSDPPRRRRLSPEARLHLVGGGVRCTVPRGRHDDFHLTPLTSYGTQKWIVDRTNKPRIPRSATGGGAQDGPRRHCSRLHLPRASPNGDSVNASTAQHRRGQAEDRLDRQAQAPGHPRAIVWLRLAAWDS